MKKMLALALGMLLVPFTAFAGLQSISESEMESITGQSGVAIALDDVKIYTHEGDSEIWYRTNSLDGATDEYDASVGIVWSEDSYQMMHVNAIFSETMGTSADALSSPGRPLQGTYVDTFNYGNVEAGGGNKDDAFASSALTIRVLDNLPIISAAKANAGNGTGAAGIIIGLPTVEIFTEAGSSDVMEILISRTGENPLGDRRGDANVYSFGTIYSSSGNSTTAILDGHLEITPYESYREGF